MPLNRKEIIAKEFGNYSKHYNNHAYIQKHVAKKLASFLPDITQPKILEIGCGTGLFTKHLINKYPEAELHITDISENMLNYCKQNVTNLKNCQFFIMDGENPSCDDSYDLIVSSMSVQWFNDSYNALTKLSDKGRVLYSAVGKNSFKEWHNILTKENLPSGTIDVKEYPRVFKQEEIKQIYSSAFDFLKSIKMVGAGTAAENYSPLNAKQLKKAIKAFDAQYKGEVTWHIVYGDLI